MSDHKTIEDALKDSESKRKELERSKAAQDAAVKLETDLKLKLEAAEKARKAADTSVHNAEAAATAAADFAKVSKELADGRAKQVVLLGCERALARAKDEGVKAEVLAALEKDLAAAKAAAPPEAHTKELEAQIEKHEQTMEAARVRAEAEKRLAELTAKEPAAQQRLSASVAVLRKAVAEADQASAGLSELRDEIEKLHGQLEGNRPAPSAKNGEKQAKPRNATGDAETATAR